MKFEFEHALRDLDHRTPSYLQEEIFHHGSLKLKALAVEVLRELEPSQTSRRLRAMLRLTP